VALLTVGVTVFCWVLLLTMSAEPTGAQTGGTTGETTGVTTRAQNDDANQRQYDDNNKKNRVVTVKEQTVIIRTIPAKPLPPTGGLPVYVMVGGSILAGTGLLAGRLAARRGRHG
jgi:hypothetical protein